VRSAQFRSLKSAPNKSLQPAWLLSEAPLDAGLGYCAFYYGETHPAKFFWD
jgi:hypothetical protein